MSVDIPTLHTERLVLRELRDDDLPAYHAMMSDVDVARFLTLDGKPLNAEDSWRQIAMLRGHWELRGFGMWAVAERERPDVLIGRLGPHQPHSWPDFEIGWGLAKPYWGKGYATEGAREALRFAFEDLDKPRIISVIDPLNERSASVARRLGEKPIGDHDLRGTKVRIWGLERDDWKREGAR